MIIRERQDDIVMISQDDHARISGLFASAWKDSLFFGTAKRDSVQLAITEHDRGWIPVDNTPFLNDKINVPYSFMDFPDEPKLVFYKNGIDEVEAMDNYASMLCSHHYSRFAEGDTSEEAQEFIQGEKARQLRVKVKIKDFDEPLFQFHYDLLKFCDSLSLYLCLNEPGTQKEDEHYFYKKGFPVPSTFSFFEGDKMDIRWGDKQTIFMSRFPFEQPLSVEIKQRVLSRSAIAEKGLLEAYCGTPIESVHVVLRQG